MQSVTVALLCSVESSYYWITPEWHHELPQGVNIRRPLGGSWEACRHSVLKQSDIFVVLSTVCLWQMLQDFKALFVENNKLFPKFVPLITLLRWNCFCVYSFEEIFAQTQITGFLFHLLLILVNCILHN